MTAFLLTLAGAALAVALELLEAMAIVLAVAAERGRRDALIGAGGAVVLLALAGFIAGPVVLARIPLEPLQVVIGVALLLFGLEWLRKGVLRLAGRRAPSSSLAEYLEEREALHALAPPAPGRADWPARIVAGKGVLLEGLEVVLIVAALGAGEDGLAPALAGAVVAVVAVIAIGVVAHRPLAAVPENTLKYVVGLLLATFGTFWAVEGLGIFAAGHESLSWPGDDWALLALLACWLVVSQIAIRVLRRALMPRDVAVAGGTH